MTNMEKIRELYNNVKNLQREYEEQCPIRNYKALFYLGLLENDIRGGIKNLESVWNYLPETEWNKLM